MDVILNEVALLLQVLWLLCPMTRYLPVRKNAFKIRLEKDKKGLACYSSLTSNIHLLAHTVPWWNGGRGGREFEG